MSASENKDTPEEKDSGVLGNRSPFRKFLHMAFWAALFYAMAAGLAKFLEWVDPARY